MANQRMLAGAFLALIFIFFVYEKRALEREARAAHASHSVKDETQRNLRDFIAIQQHHMRTVPAVTAAVVGHGGRFNSGGTGDPAEIIHGDEAHELPPLVVAATPAVVVAARQRRVDDDDNVTAAQRVSRRAAPPSSRAPGDVLDYAAVADADASCPLPPLHPHKWAAKFGWGVRKPFPKCGLERPFSRIIEADADAGGVRKATVEFHEHGIGAVADAGDALVLCEEATMAAYGFDEMTKADFDRMRSTLDAEARQNYLKDRFAMQNVATFGKKLPRPVKSDDSSGESAVWVIADVRHPYVIAVCGAHHEMHVREMPTANGAEAPKPEKGAIRTVAEAVAAGAIPNVLHIMFDSTSIHALRRGAKRIVQWMETLNNAPRGVSSVFPMRHYHAVSCCSPGNQIPVYSGNMNGEGDPFVNAEPFPTSGDWIWNIAAKRGFRTFWSLDNCPDKSARDYHAYPTVHSRVVAPLCVAGVLLSHKDATCLAGRTVDQHVLDGLESFWAHHAVERKFAAVQLITPHEETEKLLIELDVLVADFFQRFEASGALNNTAVIFWSDHGINFGRYASTHDGEIEKMFPFVNVILPRWFEGPFASALRTNGDRLVTPYDVYELSRRLVHHPAAPPPFTHDTHNPRLPTPGESHIMASFRKPITPIDIATQLAPVGRTCLAANIPMEFCTCLPWTPSSNARHTAFVQRAVAHHRRLLANLSALCHDVEFDAAVLVEVQQWPTEYKPEGKETAKKIWMAPNRDMVRVQYRTKGRGAGHFEAVFSLSKTDDAVFDLARIDRLDAMQKKCGIVDKVTEHMCVCK